MRNFRFIDFYNPTSRKKFLRLSEIYNLEYSDFLSFISFSSLKFTKRKLNITDNERLVDPTEQIKQYCKVYSKKEGFDSYSELFDYYFNTSLMITITSLAVLGFVVLLNSLSINIYFNMMFFIAIISFSVFTFKCMYNIYPIILISKIVYCDKPKFRILYLLCVYLETFIVSTTIILSFALILS